jgi:hypothetical protein
MLVKLPGTKSAATLFGKRGEQAILGRAESISKPSPKPMSVLIVGQ